MSIDEMYDREFGEKDFRSALHSLWEEHTRYGKPWPPTLDAVKAEVESIRAARAYEGTERR